MSISPYHFSGTGLTTILVIRQHCNCDNAQRWVCWVQYLDSSSTTAIMASVVLLDVIQKSDCQCIDSDATDWLPCCRRISVADRPLGDASGIDWDKLILFNSGKEKQKVKRTPNK